MYNLRCFESDRTIHNTQFTWFRKAPVKLTSVHGLQPFQQPFYRTSPVSAPKCNVTFKELFSLPHESFKTKSMSAWFPLDLTLSPNSVLMLKRVVWKYQREPLWGRGIF